MACISVSSLHLAVKQLGLPAMDTEDLVAISQVSLKVKLLFTAQNVIFYIAAHLI